MKMWCMVAGLLVTAAGGSHAINRGETGRIAGSGPEGTYYAAKSWQDARAPRETLGLPALPCTSPGRRAFIHQEWSLRPIRSPNEVTALSP